MKGLVKKGTDGIFLHIKHGGIVRESKHEQEGFEPIEVTNIRTGTKSIKYIERYRAVEAMIKRIDWYDKEFDGIPYQGWKLILDANGISCSLDLPFESAVGTRFMKLAENIDFEQPVEISAWKTPDDKTAFTVKQNGVNVPQKYTREEPGDCPPPVQAFNKKWNFDAQKQFLHERMTQVVIPKLQALAARNGNAGETKTEETEPGVTSKDFSENKVKLLKRIQRILPQINKDETQQRLLMQNYFGVSSWAALEQLEETKLDANLEKMEDAEIPF